MGRQGFRKWVLRLAVLAGTGVFALGCSDKGKSTTPPPGSTYGESGADSTDDEDDMPPSKPIPPEMIQEIQATFRVGKIQVERCFHDLVNRKQDPKITGKIILTVKIGLHPNPESVSVFKASPSLKDKKFINCVLSEARKWSFPVWGGVQELTTPKYELMGY
jgi:hypothetical protein